MSDKRITKRNDKRSHAKTLTSIKRIQKHKLYKQSCMIYAIAERGTCNPKKVPVIHHQ